MYMAHGCTELHPRKLHVHSRVRGERERLVERFAHSFSWKRIGSRLHAPYQRILELSMIQQLSTMMMMMHFSAATH